MTDKPALSNPLALPDSDYCPVCFTLLRDAHTSTRRPCSFGPHEEAA